MISDREMIIFLQFILLILFMSVKEINRELIFFKIWLLLLFLKISNYEIFERSVIICVLKLKKLHTLVVYSNCNCTFTDEWYDCWIWTRKIWDAETTHQEHSGHSWWHKHQVTENGEGIRPTNGIHGRSKVISIHSWLTVVDVWIFCGGNKQ